MTPYSASEMASGMKYLDDVTGRRGALKVTKIGTRQTGYAKWAMDAACDLTRARELLKRAMRLVKMSSPSTADINWYLESEYLVEESIAEEGEQHGS